MPVVLSTPAHVRAHLRSLGSLLEGLHSAMISLLRSMTAGVSVWIEQNQIMVQLVERFGVQNFQYPRELHHVDIRHSSIHPGLHSTMKNLYFSSPSQLFVVLEEEVGAPLARLMDKIRAWTEEFEFCYSRSRAALEPPPGDNEEEEEDPNRVIEEGMDFLVNASATTVPDMVKERRKRIVTQVQKLDAQLSSWLRHFIPKVFGILSLVFAFGAVQFDGKLVSSPHTESNSNGCSQQSVDEMSPHSTLIQSPKLVSSPRYGRSRTDVVDSKDQSKGFQSNELVQTISSMRSLGVSETLESAEVEFFGPASAGGMGSGGGVSGPIASMASEFGNRLETSGSGQQIPRPPNQSNHVSMPSLLPQTGARSGHFVQASSTGPNNASGSTSTNIAFSGRRGVFSSREWGGDEYDINNIIKQLETSVDQGRVAFDNSISLAFAFSRSLEKVVDGILHEDGKFRSFIQIVRRSLYLLEDFVYRDYSELQAMLPLNFVKIIKHLNEEEDSKNGSKNKIKGLFQKKRKSSPGHLSHRTTAFPIRHVNRKSTKNSTESAPAWLDRPLNYDNLQQELCPNPLKTTELDYSVMDIERRRLLGLPLLERRIHLTQEAVTLSPQEERRQRLCEYVRAFNVCISGYFKRLSQVYQL